MTTYVSHGSATIFMFPPRGRFAIGSQSNESNPAANLELPRGVRIASASGWYHEEAIRAEERRDS
jgi:hypothetical protein